MRLSMIGTVSLAALIAGSAWAQGDAASPATPPSTTPAAESAAPATPASREGVSADDMMGRTVYGDGDEKLGSVSDVIIDPDSKQVKKVVIGTGGFLGIGQKTVAIEVERVEVRPEEGIRISGLTQEAIRDMPEYDADASTVSLDRPASTNPAPGAGSAGSSGGMTSSPGGSAPAPDMSRPAGSAPSQ